MQAGWYTFGQPLQALRNDGFQNEQSKPALRFRNTRAVTIITAPPIADHEVAAVEADEAHNLLVLHLLLHRRLGGRRRRAVPVLRRPPSLPLHRRLRRRNGRRLHVLRRGGHDRSEEVLVIKTLRVAGRRRLLLRLLLWLRRRRHGGRWREAELGGPLGLGGGQQLRARAPVHGSGGPPGGLVREP
jgi:hypothetical protein